LNKYVNEGSLAVLNLKNQRSDFVMNVPVIPPVCKVLKFIAWLNLICGIIGSLFFFNHQYEFQTMVAPSITQPLIIPGIACIVSGAIAAALFWAISEAIQFLAAINQNIHYLTMCIRPKEEKDDLDTTTAVSETEWECRYGQINPKDIDICPKCHRSIDSII
jgi:hypothetical protein